MRLIAIPLLLTLAAFAQPEPKTAEEFYARAQQSLGQKQNDRVIEDCTQALSFDPDFHEALLMRATAYSNLKQRDKAIADLDAVLRMHPRSSIFVFRGNQYMLLNKYDAALADFSEAIRRLPSGSAAYDLRANARRGLGDLEGASADHAKSSELRSASQSMAATASGLPGNTETIHRIGASVSGPKILYRKEPAYTEEARKAKVQGTVALSLVVDEQGVARDFKILAPLGYGLDEKAIEAVQQWKFQPGMKDGKPVSVFANIEVTFRLL